MGILSVGGQCESLTQLTLHCAQLYLHSCRPASWANKASMGSGLGEEQLMAFCLFFGRGSLLSLCVGSCMYVCVRVHIGSVEEDSEISHCSKKNRNMKRCRGEAKGIWGIPLQQTNGALFVWGTRIGASSQRPRCRSGMASPLTVCIPAKKRIASRRASRRMGE